MCPRESIKAQIQNLLSRFSNHFQGVLDLDFVSYKEFKLKVR